MALASFSERSDALHRLGDGEPLLPFVATQALAQPVELVEDVVHLLDVVKSAKVLGCACHYLPLMRRRILSRYASVT